MIAVKIDEQGIPAGNNGQLRSGRAEVVQGGPDTHGRMIAVHHFMSCAVRGGSHALADRVGVDWYLIVCEG